MAYHLPVGRVFVKGVPVMALSLASPSIPSPG